MYYYFKNTILNMNRDNRDQILNTLNEFKRYSKYLLITYCIIFFINIIMIIISATTSLHKDHHLAMFICTLVLTITNVMFYLSSTLKLNGFSRIIDVHYLEEILHDLKNRAFYDLCANIVWFITTLIVTCVILTDNVNNDEQILFLIEMIFIMGLTIIGIIFSIITKNKLKNNILEINANLNTTTVNIIRSTDDSIM